MNDIELEPVVEFKPTPVVDQTKGVSNDQSTSTNRSTTTDNNNNKDTETKTNITDLNVDEIEEMKDSFNTVTKSLLLFCPNHFFLILIIYFRIRI
jgi:hypothetical protein